MFNTNTYVLIKSTAYQSGYRIVDKKIGGFTLIDDEKEEQKIVEKLLQSGVEIFESEEEFNKMYPPLTAEDRLAQSMEFWKNIPREQWTKDVKKYFDKKK